MCLCEWTAFTCCFTDSCMRNKEQALMHGHSRVHLQRVRLGPIHRREGKNTAIAAHPINSATLSQ